MHAPRHIDYYRHRFIAEQENRGSDFPIKRISFAAQTSAELFSMEELPSRFWHTKSIGRNPFRTPRITLLYDKPAGRGCRTPYAAFMIEERFDDGTLRPVVTCEPLGTFYGSRRLVEEDVLSAARKKLGHSSTIAGFPGNA